MLRDGRLLRFGKSLAGAYTGFILNFREDSGCRFLGLNIGLSGLTLSLQCSDEVEGVGVSGLYLLFFFLCVIFAVKVFLSHFEYYYRCGIHYTRTFVIG